MIALPTMHSSQLWPCYMAHMHAVKVGWHVGTQKYLADKILTWYFEAVERELVSIQKELNGQIARR